jgi:hypothetical protein
MKILIETNVIRCGSIIGVKRQFIRHAKVEEAYEKIYSSNCSESYCYPKHNMRVVSKKHKTAYDNFVKEGGVMLYGKYNRMD